MKRIRIVLSAVCLLLCLALPAFAAEYGEPNITPQTTMAELRANPSIAGSGLWTYAKDRSCAFQLYYSNKTLEDYVGSWVAQDCADGLNMMIRNYNAGIQITYKIYSEEEIAADPTKDNAEIYYFPADEPGAKYALVLSGNVITRTAEMKECVSTAARLHDMGYAVFVMRYRVFQEADDNAPIQDIGNAVRYITEHADQFGVQRENYAVIGHSAGGQLTGLFGSDKYGYKNYGVPKPAALIMAYPIIDFNEAAPVYHALIDPGVWEQRYYQQSVADCITDDYPPVYFWYGKNDTTLMALNYLKQGPALRKALQAHGVTYKEVVYDHAAHGIGLGRGTEAEGWLNDAVAFWEQQTNQ